MSLNRALPLCVATAAVNIFTATVAFAEENFPAPLAPPTSTQSGDVFRIRRDGNSANLQKGANGPRLFGTVERSHIVPPSTYVPLEPASGLRSAVQANDYAGSVTAIPAPPPALRSKKPVGTYVWGQSAAGGYYDSTGQMPGTVMGDQLYKYGGTFMDGTHVPTSPVVCNFRGHVYKPYVVKKIP